MEVHPSIQSRMESYSHTPRKSVEFYPMSATLHNAFPAGFFPEPGTVTVAGVQVIRGSNTLPTWLWADRDQTAKQGDPLFDQARKAGDLLPEMLHPGTRDAVRRLLIERVRFNSDTAFWTPKTSRQGKNVEGWVLSTQTRRVVFPIEGETDWTQALLQAIVMTNCACGRGLRSQCPIHGTWKPWR